MNTSTILIYILASAILLLIVWIALLEHRLKKFFTGTKSENLEGVFAQIGKDLKELKEKQDTINAHLKEVDIKLSKSIRRVETIRFNPFHDAGSNQSFAMAFLNDEGNGVVLSSLYARDRMSIFAKPIKDGKSDFELSTEEKDVLEKAK